jgi:kinetochore protein NDC80
VPRSSSVSTTARVTDPRNVSDKQFLAVSIRGLVEYLTDHNYDHAISPKILTKPTNKDYYNIVMFLFKQVDPNYTCTGKIEDEIVGMFKTLNYPFSIAKSNISAVGSPHAWPHMLAGIMWLIELLTYGEAAAEAEAQQGYELDVDDPTSSEKAFYKYLSKAYGFFMSGKDQHFATLEEQFIASFESKNDLIRDQMDALNQKNLALAGEIEAVKRRSSQVPELDARRRELQQECAALQQSVDEKRRARDYQVARQQGQRTELERVRAGTAGTMREIAVLKDRVGKQEISAEDVANMVSERERLQEAQQQTSDFRQGLQRKVWEIELALRDKMQSLEDTVRSYHGIAEDLKMIPQSARNARGEDLRIEVDFRAKKLEGLLKTPVKAHIVPVLQELRQELAGMTLELRQELIGEQERLEEVQAQQTELRESRDLCESKLRRAEAVFKREKENLEQASEIHGRALDEMEGRLLRLQDTAAEEARATAATRRLAELHALRQARLVAHERQKAELLDAVTNVLGLCAAHRESAQAKLDGLKLAYGRKLESFLSSSAGTAGQRLSAAAQQQVARQLLANPDEELPDLLNLGMYKHASQSQQQQHQLFPVTPANFTRNRRANVGHRIHDEAEDTVRFDADEDFEQVRV